MFSSPKRSVLLLDFENIVRPPDNTFVAKLATWVAWLEAGEFDPARRRRKFLSKRVYWNSHCEGNRPIFERHGFDAFSCPAAVKDKKSAADIWIALDAIDVLDEYRGLEEIILLSTDTDFVPVVNRLREKKKEVVVLVNERNLSKDVYTLHADAVIGLSVMAAAANSWVKPRRNIFGFEQRPRPSASPPSSHPVMAAKQTPVPATKRAAPVTSRAPGRATTSETFDLDGAAELVLGALTVQAGQFISRATVRNVLRGVPGFATTGRHPWLGCGSYCRMLEKLATLRPQLEYISHQDKGCSMRLRKA